jgi:hypothetical protein
MSRGGHLVRSYASGRAETQAGQDRGQICLRVLSFPKDATALLELTSNFRRYSDRLERI